MCQKVKIVELWHRTYYYGGRYDMENSISYIHMYSESKITSIKKIN